MGELGVSAADATAALCKIENKVTGTFPCIWTTFAALNHEEGGAEQARVSLDAQVEKLFVDWAKAQKEPIPITRWEVSKLTARAKRKWVVARRRELKKRLTSHKNSGTDQALITGYLPALHSANPAHMATIRTAAYTQAVSRRVKRKRKQWTQQVLRDHGFERCEIDAAARRLDAAPRQRGMSNAQLAEAPLEEEAARPLPGLPRVVRSHPGAKQSKPVTNRQQRRRRDNPARKEPRTGNTTPASAPQGTAGNNGSTGWAGDRALPVPDIVQGASPEDTSYRTFEKDLRD
jgi:hypothetical protein